MKDNLLDFFEGLGLSYKYLINGFVGALVWSLYKKLSFLEAVRQIIIGSIVAGYITPIVAHQQALPIEYMAALSFIVGMTGMIIIESIYQYIKGLIIRYKRGDQALTLEKANKEISE